MICKANGRVYPSMLTRYEELKLGSVKEMSIEDIYRSSKLTFTEILNSVTKKALKESVQLKNQED